MDYTNAAVEKFCDDIYATETTGIAIQSAGLDTARCMLKITERHMNAAGYVMGGAIFTLADFTFAVAANSGNEGVTVSLNSNINFMSPSKGPVLFAEAVCIENKKKICFYKIEVSDEEGRQVAIATTTGYRPG